jgi:RHS repeat-associated protein
MTRSDRHRGSLAFNFNLCNRTRRGYIGEEELDAIGLINLNRRLYDPLLGRFLSPDPIAQGFFANPQGLNRYAYAGNAPATYSDPSGNLFWFSDFFKGMLSNPGFGLAVGAAAGILGQEYLEPYLFGSAFASSFGGAAMAGGIGGAASAAVSPGRGTVFNMFKSAAMGAAEAGAIYGVGQALGIGQTESSNSAVRIPAYDNFPGSSTDAPIRYISGDYTISPGIPNDAVTQTAGDGTKFLAPPNADYTEVFRLGSYGRTVVGLEPQGRYIRIFEAQGGVFDFQRESGVFYPAYTDASNYGVGVFMRGMRWSWTMTRIIGWGYAGLSSGQGPTQLMKDWWRRGWDDADSGMWGN